MVLTDHLKSTQAGVKKKKKEKKIRKNPNYAHPQLEITTPDGGASPPCSL